MVEMVETNETNVIPHIFLPPDSFSDYLSDESDVNVILNEFFPSCLQLRRYSCVSPLQDPEIFQCPETSKNWFPF